MAYPAIWSRPARDLRVTPWRLSTASSFLFFFTLDSDRAAPTPFHQTCHRCHTRNRDDSRKVEVRISNIEAAKALSDAVRTSLGPRGMDKMVKQADGEVIITNDGATILDKVKVRKRKRKKNLGVHLTYWDALSLTAFRPPLSFACRSSPVHAQVVHPAAKMLVELSKSQDVNAGDGTTSVVVICGSLLKKCLELLNKGVHPTIISDSMGKACRKAAEILQEMAAPINIQDREALIRAATTSLSSKVVSQHASLLAPMAVDTVLKVINPENPNRVDLRDISIIKKGGGTIDDSIMLDNGLLLNQKPCTSSGGPRRVENAKIGLIQFCISPPKTDLESTVVVNDYQQMDRILKEERNYILSIVKKIRKSGCNVLLIQKSILRDAVTDLSLHYLAKAKIFVVRDIERDQIEFISKTLNCLPVAHVDHMTPDKLGHAQLVEEMPVGGSRVTKFTGVDNVAPTSCCLLRGSNKLVLEEAERSLHDAQCVIRCLVQKPFMLAGGGAPEVEVSRKLGAWAKTLTGMESYCVKGFAEALEVIPYTLAENAGLNPMNIVTELRNHHANGDVNHGINVRKGSLTNMLEENVVQPLQVSLSAFTLATECVRMILKIDDVVPVR